MKMSLKLNLVGLVLEIVSCILAQNEAVQNGNMTLEMSKFQNVNQKCYQGERKEDTSLIFEVVGGMDTSPGRYPYLVAIQIPHPSDPESKFAHWCGGMLIENNLILTAGHCVFSGEYDFRKEPRQEQGFVIEGQLYAALNPYCRHMEGINRREISEYFVHRNFNGNAVDGDDIAILKITQPYDYQGPFVDYQSSLRVSLPDHVLYTVAGWGAMNRTDKSLQKYLETVIPLQMGFLSHFNNRECQQTLKSQYISKPLKPLSMVCFKKKGRDTCWGDSGGPVLLADGQYGMAAFGNPNKDILVGITSWGPDLTCASFQNLPGIYTLVRSHVQWIDEVKEKASDRIQKASTTVVQSDSLKITISEVLRFQEETDDSMYVDELSEVELGALGGISQRSQQYEMVIDDIGGDVKEAIKGDLEWGKEPELETSSDLDEDLNALLLLKTGEEYSTMDYPEDLLLLTQPPSLLLEPYLYPLELTQSSTSSDVTEAASVTISDVEYESPADLILLLGTDYSQRISPDPLPLPLLVPLAPSTIATSPSPEAEQTESKESGQMIPKEQTMIASPSLTPSQSTPTSIPTPTPTPIPSPLLPTPTPIPISSPSGPLAISSSIQIVCIWDNSNGMEGKTISRLKLSSSGSCCNACYRNSNCNKYLYCPKRTGCFCSNGEVLLYKQCYLKQQLKNQPQLTTVDNDVEMDKDIIIGIIPDRILD